MFVHAPRPVAVGRRLAVPMHIRQLRARVVLDASKRCGSVDALLSYQVGPTSGCPLFDLRQPLDRAWLDGRPVEVARLASHEVGEGPSATIRVLAVPQPARSVHTLRLVYRLGRPLSDPGGAYPPVLASRGGRLRWSMGMADLFDGRHLEMWFPSNLPFDQFPFELALVLAGAGTDHTLITNGAVARVGAHAWDVTFPPWFSSVSPMIELRPTDELEHASAEVTLGRSGRRVRIDAWKSRGRPEELVHEVTRLQTMLASNESTFGPFPGERYACFFHGAEGGMEYAGATTTSSSALAHEALHSWFARGVMPASDADGWWDEGFTTYLTGGGAPVPLDFDRPPVALCSRRPFQRHTDGAAYGHGSQVFGGIAAMVGQASLLRAMGRLFRLRSRTCLSTAELEQHLVLDTAAVEIVDVFHRFVYGFADPPRASGLRIVSLWVRDAADGRPWICARLSNDADAAVCRHFVVVLAVEAAGGPRSGVAAIAGFDLQPGTTRVVRAPAPAGLLGAGYGGADVDLVASVHLRQAQPTGADPGHRSRTTARRRIRRAADRREPAPAFPFAD